MQKYKENQAFSPESGTKNKGVERFMAAGCEVVISDNEVLPPEVPVNSAQEYLLDIANAKRMEVYSPEEKGKLLTGPEYTAWKKKFYESNNELIASGAEINQELVRAIGENYFTRLLRLKTVLNSEIFNDYSDLPKWREEYSRIEEKANELAHDSMPPQEQANIINKLDNLVFAINKHRADWGKDEKSAQVFGDKLISAAKEGDYLKKYHQIKEIINGLAASAKQTLLLQASINDWSAVLNDVSRASYSILSVAKKDIIAEELNKLIKEMYEKL